MKKKIIHKDCLIVAAFLNFAYCTNDINHFNMKRSFDSGLQSKHKNNPGYTKLRINLMEKIHNKDEDSCDKIENYLQNYPVQNIQSFYKQEGGNILTSLITHSKSNSALNYVLNNELLSKPSICILQNENFKIIRVFLVALSIGDRSDCLDEEEIEIVIAKLKVLLSILAQYGIQEAIENIINKEYITDTVRDCYKEAKSQLEKEAHAKFELGVSYKK